MHPLPASLIIGTGRMAYHLGHAIQRAGGALAGVVGRNPHAVADLSRALGTPGFALGDRLPTSDVFLLCVSDAAIADVARSLPADGRILIHTSGATALDALAPHAHRAVLWPIMTLSPGAPMDFRHVPIVVEADDDVASAAVRCIATAISDQVTPLDQRRRELLHAATAVSTNLPLFLLARASDLLTREGIDPALMMPSFEAMAAKARAIGPKDALTGPARRGDLPTLEKHLVRLSGDTDLRRAYALLSRMILNAYGHPTDGIEDV